MNQTIKLDTRKCDGAYGKARIATLRRGERNNALLTVKVCANGQPYDLAGKTASLVATTAAGKLVGPCPMEVAEAGTARIMLPAALYSAVGSFSGYVEIREGETLVDTTDRFGGKVIECADLDSEQAAEFTPLLGELQNAVAEEAKRVDAEKTRAQAETERDEAEKKRGKAEEQRAQDSKTRLEELAQAKTSAETATGEANTARDEAKKAATDATSAAGKATDAASLAETAKTNANTAAGEAKSAATKAETAARKADGAAETAGTAASTAERAANKADTAAGNAESMAEKANASATKADTATGKANEATVAATNAATKANEVEAKLTGNVLKGKVKETFIHVDDAFPSSLLGIEVEGACKQDGTPSPDNPVPIEVVEHPVVMLTGRNLLNPEQVAVGSPDIYSVDGGMLTVKKRDGRGWEYVPISIALTAGTYCITGDKIEIRDELNNTVVNYGSGPFTLAKDSRLKIKVGTIERTYPYVSKAQIVRGGMASDYAPYTSQSLAFTLPVEHPYLAKLPDGTADEIRIDREGNVELVARVARIKVPEGTTWNIQEQQGGFSLGYKGISSLGNIKKRLKASALMCDKFMGKSTWENNPCFGVSDVLWVVPKTNQGDITSEDVAAVANGMVFYAPLATSVTYPIGKIEMPKAQDSVSNVWTDAEVTPRTGIEYTRDVNIVVANLESAIASITEG